MNRNITIAYFLSFLKHSYFWLGVWVFYYLLFTNYAGIGLIETGLIVAMTVGEIPTGAVADLFGKKATLIVSFILHIIGMSMVAFALNFYWLFIGIIIAGVGVSFYSGTIDALIYDSLKQLGQQDRYDKVISRYTSISLIGPAICSVIGGFLYVMKPNYPFIAQVMCFIVALILTFFIQEPKIKDAVSFSFENFLKQTRSGFHQLFKDNFVIEQTILLLSTGGIIVICDEMLNSFLGVEFKFSPSQLAILWAAIYLVAAVASHYTPYLKKLTSYKNVAVLVGILIAVSLMVSPVLGMILGGLTLVLRSSLQAVYGNVSSVLINETTESQYRATTLSTFNLMKNIPYVASAFFIGSLADHFSAINIAFFLGMILLVLIAFQAGIYMNKKRAS